MELHQLRYFVAAAEAGKLGHKDQSRDRPQAKGDHQSRPGKKTVKHMGGPDAGTGSSEQGPLYSLDLRLRPHGRKGQVAVSIEELERYFASEELHLSRALKRQGRFVIVRAPVVTSARKLRLFSAHKLLGHVLRFMVHGPKALRQREGLDLWYDDRLLSGQQESNGKGAP